MDGICKLAAFQASLDKLVGIFAIAGQMEAFPMLLPISDLHCIQYGSSFNPSREVCISPAAQPDKWRHTVRGGSLKHPAIGRALMRPNLC